MWPGRSQEGLPYEAAEADRDELADLRVRTRVVDFAHIYVRILPIFMGVFEQSMGVVWARQVRPYVSGSRAEIRPYVFWQIWFTSPDHSTVCGPRTENNGLNQT